MASPERWDDIAYLQHGTERQREAYRTITSLNLFAVLRPFSPVLCGTIPLAIDVPGSDLDIICEAHDLTSFEETVRSAFGGFPNYAARFTEKDGLPACVCRFTGGSFPIEIFGQPRPVQEQNAHRHMVVEARLLTLGGPGAFDAIRELKARGLKTEPAFAAYFGLTGDPYNALLNADMPVRQKVLAYIVRQNGERRELLVFDSSGVTGWTP